MSVEQDLRSGLFALDMADTVPILIHMYVCEAFLVTELLHLLYHLVFVAAVALCLDHLLAKCDQLLFSFLAKHIDFLLTLCIIS